MADHLSANGTEPKSFAALDCIDLSNPDIQQTAALLKQACLDSGIFYVINHGISEEFMDEVFAQSKKFFALPLSEKMKAFRGEKYRGYSPPLQEFLAYETTKRDHREIYIMGSEVPEDDPYAESPFFTPNVWPPTDFLPGWKETMQRYYSEALDVIRAIARIVALALDLDMNFFDQPGVIDRPISEFRLIRYEGHVEASENKLYGTGAHTDYGILTVLATDDVLGLQICRDKDAKPQIWEYVQPLKGAFIVNIGDLMERFSNCLLRSTLHRVVVEEDRYSIGVFIGPNPDFVVECSPTCKSEENPPKFPPIKSIDYFSSRIKDLRNLNTGEQS